eukprot:2852978-Prymnesium_polylepis.1
MHAHRPLCVTPDMLHGAACRMHEGAAPTARPHRTFLPPIILPSSSRGVTACAPTELNMQRNHSKAVDTQHKTMLQHSCVQFDSSMKLPPDAHGRRGEGIELFEPLVRVGRAQAHGVDEAGHCGRGHGARNIEMVVCGRMLW